MHLFLDWFCSYTKVRYGASKISPGIKSLTGSLSSVCPGSHVGEKSDIRSALMFLF